MKRFLNNFLIVVVAALLFLAIYLSSPIPIFQGIGLVLIYFIYNKFFEKEIDSEQSKSIKDVFKILSFLLSVILLIVSSYILIAIGFVGGCKEMAVLLCFYSAIISAPAILIGTILFCNAIGKNIIFKILSIILLICFIFIEILLVRVIFINTEQVSLLLLPAIITTFISIIILIKKINKKDWFNRKD